MPRKPLTADSKRALKRFGENLRIAREEAGLSQERTAELVDLHPRVLQKIEAGQVNTAVANVFEFRRVLGCSWNKILKDI